jgi:molecular chaperone GrpE
MTEQERHPRKVKVTDKRRVHGEPAAHGGGRPPVVDPDGEPELGVAEGIDARDEELEEARRQAGEYLEHLQRLQAEFDNYRKRILREQTRAVEMASEPLARRLLEVLDEFDLALMAAERRPDFEQFLHGVELVYAKLLDILRAEGLERIEAEGKPFDPERHEAVVAVEQEDTEPGMVVDIVRAGYELRGKVLRPAMVKVAK